MPEIDLEEDIEEPKRKWEKVPKHLYMHTVCESIWPRDARKPEPKVCPFCRKDSGASRDFIFRLT